MEHTDPNSPDLSRLSAAIEALVGLDPADAAEPAAEIAEALGRALDEEDL